MAWEVAKIMLETRFWCAGKVLQRGGTLCTNGKALQRHYVQMMKTRMTLHHSLSLVATSMRSTVQNWMRFGFVTSSCVFFH